jgi:anti-anti-sigma factor
MSSPDLSHFIAQETLEAMPFVITIYDTKETLVGLNALAEAVFKAPRAELIGRVKLSDFDSDPQMAEGARAARRALLGEHVRLPSIRVDLREIGTEDLHLPKGIFWLDARYFPLRDAGGRVCFAMLINTDQTALVREREALELLRDEVMAQRETIRALSSPIIQVWRGVLALPVIGALDATRASDMTARLLQEVTATRATYVILDLTGLTQIESTTADHLVRILRAIELLGAQGMLVGVKPAISRTLIDLGANLHSLSTFRTLGDALERCLSSQTSLR